MDYSQPGSSVHEILQAGILRWFAISSAHWMLLCSSSYWLLSYFLGFFSLTMSVGRGTLMSPLLELSWQLFSLRGFMAKWSRELTGESNRLAATLLAVSTWKKYPTSGCQCMKWYGQTQYLTLTLWWPLFQFLNICACVCAELCPTLCDSHALYPPGIFHGILQARILEWVAIPYSRGSSWPRDETWVSCDSFTGRWILYH